MSPTDLVIAGLAAVAAGAVNALAGGGTLITFPALTALGMPAIAANVTNTVALCPGYLGGVIGQARDLEGQASRLWWSIPAGLAGGWLGGWLLLQTGEHAFRALVPYLILLASVLLALQEPIRGHIVRLTAGSHSTTESSAKTRWSRLLVASLAICAAAVYGGYFGAGLSVILLAILGLMLNDPLPRLNALKQAIAFAANVAAAALFVGSREVQWPVAAVMAAGALLGGFVGGRLAGRTKTATLRRAVVTAGVLVALIYFVT